MLKAKAAHPRGGTVNRTSGMLPGKLFDENGGPLYFCSTKRRGRHYRYFVSKHLVRSEGSSDRGWRPPAKGTERAVLAGVRQLLSGQPVLASTLKALGFSAAELKQAIELINARVKSLEQIATPEDARSVIERVDLKGDGMQIALNLRALLPVDRFPNGGPSLQLTRLVPMQMRRRGIETRLIIPGEEIAPATTDPALLRALARGYQWFGELAAGTAASTKQIATREGRSESYVRHMVPLALLAPSIVESICAGRQSVSLSAERLKSQAGIPIEWDEQTRLLAD